MEIEGTQIVAGQWSAILDAGTCELCETLDGQIFDINNVDALQMEPPVHVGCRCIIAYIGAEELQENWTPDFTLPPQDLLDNYAGLKELPEAPIIAKTPGGREIVQPKVKAQLPVRKWLKKLTEPEKEAAKSWKTSAKTIIDYQRTGVDKTYKGKKASTIVKILSKSLRNVEPYEGTVYRTLYNIPLDKLDIYSKAQTLEWETFQSATKVKRIAEDWWKGKGSSKKGGIIIFEIKNKTGVDITKAGHLFELEKEVIMFKGAKYKVVSSKINKTEVDFAIFTVLHIALEEI